MSFSVIYIKILIVFQERQYRNEKNTVRFHYFNVVELESDLMIGVSQQSEVNLMKQLALHYVKEARDIISAYGSENSQFLFSHQPFLSHSNVHPLISQMQGASKKANVGPMASVAGAVAEYTGQKLYACFPESEIIVENGGDIWASYHNELCIKVYAGEDFSSISPVLLIPTRFSPCGICSSSAIFGHSFSYGKADCVTVICRDAALADAYATSLCNQICCESDMEKVASQIEQEPLILACFAAFRGKILLYGDIKFNQSEQL